VGLVTSSDRLAEFPAARCPPPEVLARLEELDAALLLGTHVRGWREPDALVQTIKADSDSVSWLPPILARNPATLLSATLHASTSQDDFQDAPQTLQNGGGEASGGGPDVSRLVQRLAESVVLGDRDGAAAGSGAAALQPLIADVGHAAGDRRSVAVRALNLVLRRASVIAEEASRQGDTAMETETELLAAGGEKGGLSPVIATTSGSTRRPGQAWGEGVGERGDAAWLDLLSTVPGRLDQVGPALQKHLREALTVETDAALLLPYLHHLSHSLPLDPLALSRDVARLILSRPLLLSFLSNLPSHPSHGYVSGR
ncbi:hypothetical protein T484DRAFT_1765510, partial [Baffinella frigidus]